MNVQVIDGVKGLAAREGLWRGRHNADDEASGEGRTGGAGDAVQILEGNRRLGFSGPNPRNSAWNAS